MNNVFYDAIYQETIFNVFPYKLPAFPKVHLTNSQIHQLHYHDTFEIGYCYQGRGECIFENKITTFKKGDAEIFFPHQPHISRSHSVEKSVWDFSYFKVSDVFLGDGFEVKPWENLVESKNGLCGIIKREKYPHICDCIEKIITISNSNDNNKLLKCRLLIGELLVYIMECGNPDGETLIKYTEPIAKLSPALTYIKHNYNKPMTIPQLAGMCSMSVSSFRENFSRQMKMSPQEYLISTKMRFAKYYLENSSKTIKEICSKCGFQDTANFYKQFSKRFGVAPTMYRKQINNASKKR